MKVTLASFGDLAGGAARAAFRLHEALQGQGISSTMLVRRKDSDEPNVIGPTKARSLLHLSKARAVSGVAKALFKTKNPVMHSFGVIPTRLRFDNAIQTADVVNLHWVGLEMMSIGDIGALSKPCVWTMHDMWSFCGAEHYTADDRWRRGYSASSRAATEEGLDLNRAIWRLKQSRWKRPITLVSPSRWLASLARESPLTSQWNVRVIPNAINTEAWKPIESDVAKRILGISRDRKLVVFGSMGGAEDHRKGFDLLTEALTLLGDDHPELLVGVIGKALRKSIGVVETKFFGHISDDIALRVIYSAADAVVLPSRMDNLPNIGVESLACGTPLVAFNVGGMPDLIAHGVTGYLAKPFDTTDLATGIRDVALRGVLDRGKCREAAENTFAYPVISKQYEACFKFALDAET